MPTGKVNRRMTKQLNKWLRKFHRWIAIPTALLIPIAAVIKLIGSPDLLAAWAKLEKIPSILMLIMAITGAYLYLAPYIAKGQRKKNIHPVHPSTCAASRGFGANHCDNAPRVEWMLSPV